jgi:c-di-AMP phosphodiesterase-like protein
VLGYRVKPNFLRIFFTLFFSIIRFVVVVFKGEYLIIIDYCLINYIIIYWCVHSENIKKRNKEKQQRTILSQIILLICESVRCTLANGWLDLFVCREIAKCTNFFAFYFFMLFVRNGRTKGQPFALIPSSMI